jgi:hypothetical protein
VGSVEKFAAADREFAPAMAEVKRALKESGVQVAGGAILRFCTDITHIYTNLACFAADEVETWLDRMSGAMAAYRGRLTAMLDAALDDDQYRHLLHVLEQRGMAIRRRGRLRMAHGGDLAWFIVASRVAQGSVGRTVGHMPGHARIP